MARVIYNPLSDDLEMEKADDDSGKVSGSGSATQVTYWTGPSSIGGDDNLWWDPTNHFLGIQNKNPKFPLHIIGLMGASIEDTGIVLDGFGGTDSAGLIAIRFAGGTPASPTAVPNGQLIGGYGVAGFDGSDYQSTIQANGFTITATEDWAPGRNGTRLDLLSTPNGLAVPIALLSLREDFTVRTFDDGVIIDTSGNLETIGSITIKGGQQLKLTIGGAIHIASDGGGATSISDSAHASFLNYTLPDSIHELGFLMTDTSGTLSWTAAPPRLTTTQRDALTLVDGLFVYNTTLHVLQVYDSSAAAWETVTTRIL